MNGPQSILRSGRAVGLLALEPPRAAGELGLLGLARPALARAPRGDQHPVLVMPGLGTTDGYTRPLRGFLRRLGYHVHGFRLGRNIPTPELLDGLRDRVEAVIDQHGDTPISIVGWSLGGLYGREIARGTPERVRQVITLGTPFRNPDDLDAPVLQALRRANRIPRPTVAQQLNEEPPPVPVSAIMSRSDGIVPWPVAHQETTLTTETIEVVASHCGLPHHPGAWWAIADRLAQPAEAWAPFEARGMWRAAYVRR